MGEELEVFEWLSDAGCRSLETVDKGDLKRFEPFDGSPMAPAWHTVRLRWRDAPDERRLPKSDCPALLAFVPTFSEKAVVALRDLLEPAGELLQLDVPGERFYAFNVTSVLEVLDEAASDVKRFEDGGVMRIVRYAFKNLDAIRQQPIFKIPQQRRSRIYVTTLFHRRVDQAGLTGFDYRPLWKSG